VQVPGLTKPSLLELLLVVAAVAAVAPIAEPIAAL